MPQDPLEQWVVKPTTAAPDPLAQWVVDEEIKPVASHAGPSEHPHARVGRFVVENLPTIAAMGATALAPESLLIRPAIAGGAASLGALARGDAPSAAAWEGLQQAGGELAGGALSKGLLKGGTRLYRGLLKPVAGVRESFGNVAQHAVEEGIPITAGGLEKATAATSASRAKALSQVAEAEAAGTPGVTLRQAVNEFPDVVKELRKRADIGQADKLATVGERGRRLGKTVSTGPTADIPLTRAQELKETAQEAASGAYRQVQSGSKAQLSPKSLLDKAVATGLRKGIEERVPSVAAQNLTTQRNLGIKMAVEDALDRQANNLAVGGARDLIAAGVGGTLGYGAGGAAGGTAGATTAAMLMRALSTPSHGSRIAIGMNRAAKVPFAQLSRAAILALLQGQEPEQ